MLALLASKYLSKISKKRDLSGESNPEEDRKKNVPEDEVFQQIRTRKYISEVLEYLKTLGVKISEI